MSKAISPVIASVLLILVAITLVSTYSFWSAAVFGKTAETAEASTARTVRALFSDLTIESVTDQRVFIKNIGTSDLTAPALSVFYDGQPLNFTADFVTLKKDELGTLTLQGLWKYGLGKHALKVSAGSFSDEKTVTASHARGSIGDWLFEEGMGTMVDDSSENNNNGVIRNGGTWTKNTPHAASKNAFSSDGVNDYTDVAHASLFDYTGGDITISVWFWADPTETGSWILSKPWNGSGQYNYRVYYDGSFVSFNVYGDPEFGLTTTELVKEGAWNHVAASVEGSTKKVTLYLNGVAKSTTHSTTNFNPPSGDSNLPLTIGTLFPYGEGWGGNTDFTLKGFIDEPRIYDRALGADQLIELSF